MQLGFDPIIRLMNRLTYPRKFLLISLLFALPLIWVLLQFIVSIDSKINVAQQELDGDQYLRPLRVLYQHVLQDQLWTQEYLDGVSARLGDLTGNKGAIDNDFVALAGVEQAYGAEFQTGPKLRDLQASWQSLKTVAAWQRPALYTAVITKLRSLIAQVGDYSTLILDPDLDSYYTMDTILVNLPRHQQYLADTMSQADQMVVQQAVPAAARAEVISLIGQSEDRLGEIGRGLTVAFQNNPTNRLKTALEPRMLENAATAEAYLQLVDTNIINAPVINATPALQRGMGQTALQASFALWDSAIVELDHLLQARIDGFNLTKAVTLIVTLLAFGVVTYCWIGFYQAVMKTVRQLARASERMVSGDLTTPVQLENQDELGAVVRAFNEVAAALVEARAAQQQRTVAELRAAAIQLSSAAEQQQAITGHTHQVAAQVLEAFQVLERAAIAITSDAAAVEEQAQILKEQNQRGNGAIVAFRHILTEMQQTALMLEHGAQALAEDARLASTLVEEANEVAATTQLLGLNATIEAAGAGQQGARFGIIAEEVRALAGSAAQAAQTIGTALQRIAAETATAASGTHQTRLSIDDGAAQVQVLHTLMQSLLDSAEGLVENAEHIRERSEEQRSRSAEVHEGSRQLASIIEQLTGASQNVAAQAQGLLRLAQVLDTAEVAPGSAG